MGGTLQIPNVVLYSGVAQSGQSIRFGSEGSWVRIPPLLQILRSIWQGRPIGRVNRLRPDKVWVRIPPLLQIKKLVN